MAVEEKNRDYIVQQFYWYVVSRDVRDEKSDSI